MWQDLFDFSPMHLVAQDFLAYDLAGAALDIPGAERSALAADSLRASGHLRLRVRGESMLPSLWPGDSVEIVRCSPEDVRPGEIVLALREGRFFLHRLLTTCKPNGFLLQGDSVPAPDPLYPNSAFLGRLAGRARRAQWFISQSRANGGSILPLRPWSWALGRLFCYCGPARRLALKFRSFFQQWQRNVQNPERFSRDGAIDLEPS